MSASLHTDLLAADLPDWAAKVADVVRSVALKAAAEYTWRNSKSFAQDGAGRMSPEASFRHRQHIEALADELDALAGDVIGRTVRVDEIEAIMVKLMSAGFFLEPSLASAIARSFVDPPVAAT